MTEEFFAITAPGLSSVTATALSRCPGVTEIEAGEEGVVFRASLADGVMCNLSLRTASRVLLRLTEIKSRDFNSLRKRLAALPWHRFVAPGQAVRVEVTAHRCRLYHSAAIAERARAAMGEVLQQPVPTGSPDDQRVFVRGVKDKFTVSVDTTGALLHRRGYRIEAGAAPLRETLAAGLLSLCGWQPGQPLADPMCGSGTIAIEAALWAAGVPPGWARGFAFEHWPCIDDGVKRLIDRARQATGPVVATRIFASDRDPTMIELARANATRAGVTDRAAVAPQFSCARFADQTPPPEAGGLLLFNPPYGVRLTGRDRMKHIYQEIGRSLAGPWRLWRAGILVGDQQAARNMGLAPAQIIPLRNGGLRVWLLVFEPRP